MSRVPSKDTVAERDRVVTLTGHTINSGNNTIVMPIGDLSDVAISGPTNGQILIWSTGNARFENGDNTDGTVTSVSALTLGTAGTDLNSSVANSTTTPVITLNVPDSSGTNRGALTSTDWTTFNSKQNTLSLTTTGTSGAATLIADTLNIPIYAPQMPYDIIAEVYEKGTTVATGTEIISYRIPRAFTLTNVRADVTVAQSTGNILTFDVTLNGSSIFTTNLLTIDNTELTSSTATTGPNITTTAMTSDGLIEIDCTQVGDSTAQGLRITLIGYTT